MSCLTSTMICPTRSPSSKVVIETSQKTGKRSCLPSNGDSRTNRMPRLTFAPAWNVWSTSTARNTKKIRSKFRLIQFKSAQVSANQKNGSHTRPKRTSGTVRTRLSLLKSIGRYRVTTLKTSSSNLAQTSIRMISPSKTCSIRNLTQVWSSRRLSIGKTRISTTVWGSSLIRAKKSSKLVTYPFCSIPWRSKTKS